MKTFAAYFGILTFLFMCQSVFSQNEVKTKKVRETFTDPFPYQEVYHVLKENKDIRHGAYQKENDYWGVFCKGAYDMGKPSGLWTFYDTKDRIGYQVDYNNGGALVISDDKIKQETIIINSAGAEEKDTVDRLAICKMGYQEMRVMMSSDENMKYPAEARENNIEGTVVVVYHVNEVGYMEIIRIRKSIHPILDQIALNVAQSLATQVKWYPAIKDGKPVKTRFFLPINFGLTR